MNAAANDSGLYLGAGGARQDGTDGTQLKQQEGRGLKYGSDASSSLMHMRQ